MFTKTYDWKPLRVSLNLKVIMTSQQADQGEIQLNKKCDLKKSKDIYSNIKSSNTFLTLYNNYGYTQGYEKYCSNHY